MMRIKIIGPQNCGKTRLAEIIAKILSYSGKTVLIAEDREKIHLPKQYDVVINTIQR